MVTKRNIVEYICRSCNGHFIRWSGQCENCGKWNSLVKSHQLSAIGTDSKAYRQTSHDTFAFQNLSDENYQPLRLVSGISELDRVTGGGFVPGSVLLLGGDPGIGKSSLLLQVAAVLAENESTVIYISGEEAISQVRLRANRLGVASAPVRLAAQTNVDDIIATLISTQTPDLIVIDSIQTLWLAAIDSPSGTVNQLRACVQHLIRYAKQRKSVIVLVGHVTKDGQIAGPRAVEHMVDAVLSFEGDSQYRYRLLRASKNRFGATDEIGVFEMTGTGLLAVTNPSEFFLGERNALTPGSAVFAGLEGSRPVLIEIQALVCPSSLGTPRRTVVGWDTGRLAMLLAVLQTHCKIRLSEYDVYLNVAGGLRITEPAADLAVAAAIISSLSANPLPSNSVYFGEVSLSGAIRPVAQERLRLREAAKLGFTNAVVPTATKNQQARAQNANDKVDPELIFINMVDSLSHLAASIATDQKQA